MESVGLVSSAKRGDLEAVRMALERGEDPDQLPSQWSEEKEKRALHHASYLGNAKMVELLVRHGADVHRKERDSYTPLHYAVFFRHHETARVLMDAGADPNVEDDEGKTPLQRARANGDDRMICILSKKKEVDV